MRCSIRRTIRTFFFAQSRTSWVLFGHSPATASMSRNFHEYARLVMRTFPSTTLPRPPPPRLPVRHWRTRHFFRRLYASWNYTDLIQAPSVCVYTCKDVYVRVRARVCATLDHWLSSTVVPNFTSCSPSSLFVDSLTVISLLSLTSIEYLDRFLRHLSFSMGTSQQIFCFFV